MHIFYIVNNQQCLILAVCRKIYSEMTYNTITITGINTLSFLNVSVHSAYVKEE